jgi:hypothetical protein
MTEIAPGEQLVSAGAPAAVLDDPQEFADACVPQANLSGLHKDRRHASAPVRPQASGAQESRRT